MTVALPGDTTIETDGLRIGTDVGFPPAEALSNVAGLTITDDGFTVVEEQGLAIIGELLGVSPDNLDLSDFVTDFLAEIIALLPSWLDSVFSVVYVVGAIYAIVIIVAAITYYFLTRRKTGKYVYAIGSNEDAVQLAGINIKLVKCGGMTPALRMINRGRSLGMKVMIGCMTESTVGISATITRASGATSSTWSKRSRPWPHNRRCPYSSTASRKHALTSPNWSRLGSTSSRLCGRSLSDLGAEK